MPAVPEQEPNAADFFNTNCSVLILFRISLHCEAPAKLLLPGLRMFQTLKIGRTYYVSIWILFST